MTGTRVFRALAGTALLMGGCGPVEYVSNVSNRAATALAQAQQAEAERYAPYEYRKACEYLLKAREEGGKAEFQTAIDYGRKSEDLALRSRTIARQKQEADQRRRSVPGPSEPRP